MTQCQTFKLPYFSKLSLFSLDSFPPSLYPLFPFFPPLSNFLPPPFPVSSYLSNVSVFNHSSVNPCLSHSSPFGKEGSKEKKGRGEDIKRGGGKRREGKKERGEREKGKGDDVVECQLILTSLQGIFLSQVNA